MICWNCYTQMVEYHPTTGGTGRQWQCPACSCTECGTPPGMHKQQKNSIVDALSLSKIRQDKINYCLKASEILNIAGPKAPDRMLWSQLIYWYVQ